jgi:hypothetical protein
MPYQEKKYQPTALDCLILFVAYAAFNVLALISCYQQVVSLNETGDCNFLDPLILVAITALFFNRTIVSFGRWSKNRRLTSSS